LIIPDKGSYFLLGELFVDIGLEYDKPVLSRCGSCKKCILACPGSALSVEDGLDSNRCISYLTIEKKGPFNIQESRLCGENNYLFGCDICQDICPWNRFSREQTLPFMQPVPEILNLEPDNLKNMSDSDFKKHFFDTCLYRTGIDGLRRNSGALIG
jgi:epoxyqueuosine reductase